MDIILLLILTLFPVSQTLATRPVKAIEEKILTDKVNFEIQIGEEINDYRIYSAFVLPNAELPISVLSDYDRNFQIVADKGVLSSNRKNGWIWQAPDKKGMYSITVKDESGGDMQINIFVMVPIGELKGEYLNGYRIGKYPQRPLKGKAIYNQPSGFIEITKENQDTFLTPHLKLSQFVCKQKSGFPKYIVLKEKLLLKLEYLLETVNQKGYVCSSFYVMSGYRTPYYNQAIGNVQFSRHAWGDAADIFIDEDKDGNIDDLNRDNRVDHLDGEVLFDIIDGLNCHKRYKPYIGGLGKYLANASHGPFVHVDVRGSIAKWGYQLLAKK